MDVLTFEDVYYAKENVPVHAVVKMAATGVGIKETATAVIHTVKAEEIKEMVEHFGIIGHSLRIAKRDGYVYTLDGLSADVLESIKQYVKKHYKLNLYHRPLAVDGNVNGEIEVLDSVVEMKIQDKTVFEIPLSSVSNAYERRGEGIVDIKENIYGVTEIRFGCFKGESNVQKIIEQIKGSTVDSTQIEILQLEEIVCVLPRGRSKLSLTSTGIHLVGKTYSHHILYSSVQRMFLLERSPEEGGDEMSYLIMELTTPIRQGQTRYSFVCLLVPEEQVRILLGKNSQIEYEEESIEENAEEKEVENNSAAIQTEEDRRHMLAMGLKNVYVGSLAECLTEIIERLSKVEAMKAGPFSTVSGAKALKCSMKANEGYLYPLEKGLLFMPKIAYTKYEEISAVEFSRVNLSTRTAKTFDMRVILDSKKEYMYNALQKTEFGTLEAYLTQKNVRCRSEVGGNAWKESDVSENDEEEDEETASEDISSSEEEEEEENK